MLQHVANRLDVRMGISEILRDPPALHAAIGQGGADLDDPAFFRSLFDDIGQKVDPCFRSDVGLALLRHGSDGRHGVADGDLGAAAIAFIENEFVDARQHFGALPVHAGDGHAAAFGGM
ncbi:hypothetical protein D9M72_516630 [compost metagenome]